MRAHIVVNKKLNHQGVWADAFGTGLARHGWKVTISSEPMKSDLCVFWGVRRSNDIEWAKKECTDVCILERGYFPGREDFTSVSFGGGLNRRGNFSSFEIDEKRLQRHWPALLKPWQEQTPRNALIFGQVEGDMSIAGVDIRRKYRFFAQGLRDCDLTVRFRPHPQGGSQFSEAPEMHGTLRDALQWADLTCAWNSNAGVDSILAGVPHICFDEGAMAYDVSAQCFHPYRPSDEQRLEWAEELSYWQWNSDEMASGECWEHARHGSKVMLI